MRWDAVRLGKDRLVTLSKLLGGLRIAKILEKYARDYKFWNHGMPDLLLWSTDLNIIRFSEVKSENDKLSEVQRAWLSWLSRSGIDCEICLVNHKLPEETEGKRIDGPFNVY